MTRTPTLANNRVRLLVNGEASFEAMFKAISAARQVILVQFFIVRDGLGQRLQQLLLERAANGVEVFFLYDAIGSHALPHRFVERLRRAACRCGFAQRHAQPLPGEFPQPPQGRGGGWRVRFRRRA